MDLSLFPPAAAASWRGNVLYCMKLQIREEKKERLEGNEASFKQLSGGFECKRTFSLI